MTPPRCLDANIILRLLTNDDEEKAELGRQLFFRIEHGVERAVATSWTVAEVVFTLQRSYRVQRARIRELIEWLLAVPHLQVAERALLLRAIQLFDEDNISFGDAYRVAFMEARGINAIYSWDRHFDRVDGITRIEPSVA